jgi:phage terminase large subunit-like protein
VPTKRKRIGVKLRRRSGELTREERLYLYSGFNLIKTARAFWDEDRDTIRKAWEANRESVLEEFKKEYPCSSPWAWWQFDAGKRRRKAWSPDFLREIEEPEHVYLKRCGLLTRKEWDAAAEAQYQEVLVDLEGYWDRATKGGEPKPVNQEVWLHRRRLRDDLERGAERGLWYDEDAADKFIAAARFLFKHYEGEWGGKPYRPAAWDEYDLFRPVFGWMSLPPGMTPAQAKRIPYEKRLERGIVRRFTSAYVEINRKNGKSTKSAVVGWYLFACDREKAANVFCGATARDQAKIVHKHAVMAREQSQDLEEASRFRMTGHMLEMPDGSVWLPLGSDKDKLDGRNSHGNIIDELHAHKSPDVYTKLSTGTGARRQPLTWAITTAGKGRNGVCWEKHEYTLQVLRGHVDDRWFGYIACVDDPDKWNDEVEWQKANPNLGISVKLRNLRDMATAAEKDPGAKRDMLQLHLGVWLAASANPMFEPERWAFCGHGVENPREWRERTIAELRKTKAPAFTGLDLGAVADLTAFLRVFKLGRRVVVIPDFWIPRASSVEREKKDHVPYTQWLREGWIRSTEGPFERITNFEQVVTDIKALHEETPFEKGVESRKPVIAFDRAFQGYQTGTDLASLGFDVVSFGQGYLDMAAPTRRCCELVAEGVIEHGNHPVLLWMGYNAVAKKGPAGIEKPDKDTATERMDGIVAMVMAIGRMMLQDARGGKSVYERRGMLTL